MSEIELSIVIACYNEGQILNSSVRNIIEFMALTQISYELIFVDDFSKDDTPKNIEALCAEFANVPTRTIFHQANTGRGGAVKDGFNCARGRYVGYLDIDLEVGISEIVPTVLQLRHGAEVVTGRRVYEIQLWYLHRHILSRAYALFSSFMLALPYRDTETGFKFFQKQALDRILNKTLDQGWFWDTEIMFQAHRHSLKVIELPVLFIRRGDKVSAVNIFADSATYLKKLWAFHKRNVNSAQKAVQIS